ncbi:MAG: hypothetical protein V4850_28480 [Myxococcota bacterium]
MLFALLSACDTPAEEEATCPDLTVPAIAVCFGGGGVTGEDFGTREADMEGTVVSIGRGPRPEACIAEVGNHPLGEGLVVVLSGTDGLDYTISLDVPGLSDTFLAVGDSVILSAEHTFRGFVPEEAIFVLADSSNAPRLIVAEASAGEALPEGPMEVTAGDTRCTTDDGCGMYAKYDMDVVVEGVAVTVPYAEEVEQDGFRFVHGGYDVDLEDEPECNDWFPAGVALAIIAD